MDDTGGLQQPEHYFTAGAAGSLVGIPSHQVRRWAQYHAEHLSPGANPEMGQPRRFTRRDVEVLRSAKTMHGQGLPVAVINERLRDFAFGEIDSSVNTTALTDSRVASPDGPQQAETALAVVNALQSVVAPLAARLEALEENQHAISAQRLQVDVAWLVVAAFIAGLLLGLAVWWFQ